jgi:1-acyl-sn-glycerol-3-phosphate acyltransferase
MLSLIPVMGIILALLCLGYILLFYDIRFRIAYSFCNGRKFEHCERFDRLQRESARSLIAAVKTYAGLKIIVEKPSKGTLPSQFMILSNHQSLADIPVLAYVFNEYTVGFVAKKELARGVPAVSFGARKGKHALISRTGDFDSARRELLKMAHYARQGVCPAIFPEGTRTRTGFVGSFHSAAVRTILEAAEMPVVSVAVNGGFKIARFKGLITNLRHCMYRVKILTLYPATSERSKIREIIRTSHAEIKKQVELWRNK